ncbi:20871_t:CDS:2 [Entrophospora sp. SA101]|nr:20871_t:CDS:2 [Entrophospora sp. SA101]
MEKYRTALETLNEDDNIKYSKDDIEFLFERVLLSTEIIDEKNDGTKGLEHYLVPEYKRVRTLIDEKSKNLQQSNNRKSSY